MPGKSTKKHPPAYKGLIGVKDSFEMYKVPKLDMIYNSFTLYNYEVGMHMSRKS